MDVEKVTEAVLNVIEKLQDEGANGAESCRINVNKCKLCSNKAVPVGISNRHVHLSQEDLETCFGKGYELTPIKDLSQPNQFASKETMTVVGPKGAIEKVRVLGPVRKESQVELLASDMYKLGTKLPVRISGDLEDSASVTIVGPAGSVFLPKGAIVAQRHIHMTPRQAAVFEVTDGQIVSIKAEGARGGILNNVIMRVSDSCEIDCHIDTDEANALGLVNGDVVTIVK